MQRQYSNQSNQQYYSDNQGSGNGMDIHSYNTKKKVVSKVTQEEETLRQDVEAESRANSDSSDYKTISPWEEDNTIILQEQQQQTRRGDSRRDDGYGPRPQGLRMRRGLSNPRRRYNVQQQDGGQQQQNFQGRYQEGGQGTRQYRARGGQVALNARSKGIRKFRPQNEGGVQRRQYAQRTDDGRPQRQNRPQFRRGGAAAGGRNPNQLQQRRPQNQGRPQQQQNQQQTPNPRPQGAPRQPRVPPTESQLKALQVKAELNKLGEAPRAYLEKIQLAESMSIESQPGQGGSKLSLNDRFGKIEGVKLIQNNRGKKTLRLVPRPKIANRGGRY